MIKNDSAKVIATSNHEITAVRNQYKKGDVVWIPSPIGLGSWQKESMSFASFVKEEIKDFIKELPFTFDTYNKNVLLKTMEAEGNYLTILTNISDENVQVGLKTKVDKTPKLIFGGKLIENIAIKNIRLAGQETVVLLWK